MKRKLTGENVLISTVGDEKVFAFVPRPLPPEPSIRFDARLQDLNDQALLALGRLDSLSGLLPDPSLFLYMYVRKEAVLSSQIEGTQSSLSDLLLYESRQVPGVPLDDVVEVSNYVAALTHGMARLREGFPLSLRLLREIHNVLLSHGRGSDKEPGEFRRSQNWIGGTRPGNARFVPPPPERLMDALGDLEKFLHGQPVRTPILIKAALAHVQFETIHPFLDGNGRLGRLLITLLLCSEGVLREPLLYLSLYFKRNRGSYYSHLQQIRTHGDWEAWLRFFLHGIIETASQAVETVHVLRRLIDEDRVTIQALGKPAGSTLRVHAALQRRPITSVANAARLSGLSVPTVTIAFAHLVRLGVVEEVTGMRRGKLYSYRRYVQVLNEDTVV